VKVLESKLNKNNSFDTNSYSDRLLRLVQVVFAVVIGGSLIQFNYILFPPQCTVEFWALFGVYVSAITSWTGYHHRMNKYPYTPTKFGVIRLFTDMFIVIMYAYLLFAGSGKGQSIESYLWGFSVVFVSWILSGLLRCLEYHDWKASELKMLTLFFLGYSFLVPLLFKVFISCTNTNTILLNQIFVGFPLITMLIFRYLHDWRHLKLRI
jgi:hypothetical protein